jgi:hypothetical protein
VGIIKLDDWKALANPGSGVAPTAAPAAGVGHGAPPPAPKPTGLPAVIPNTTVGNLVRGYVAAFNSGDVNTMRKFVESSLIVNPERSTDERLKSYLKLFEDHGPLHVPASSCHVGTSATCPQTAISSPYAQSSSRFRRRSDACRLGDVRLHGAAPLTKPR